MTLQTMASEIWKIRNLPWPHDPILPLRHLTEKDTAGEKLLGWILRDSLRSPIVVVVLGLMPPMCEWVKLSYSGTREYTSIDEMVRAGWVGD